MPFGSTVWDVEPIAFDECGVLKLSLNSVSTSLCTCMYMYLYMYI